MYVCILFFIIYHRKIFLFCVFTRELFIIYFRLKIHQSPVVCIFQEALITYISMATKAAVSRCVASLASCGFSAIFHKLNVRRTIFLGFFLFISSLAREPNSNNIIFFRGTDWKSETNRTDLNRSARPVTCYQRVVAFLRMLWKMRSRLRRLHSSL